jgi:hypothetical protein
MVLLIEFGRCFFDIYFESEKHGCEWKFFTMADSYISY